VIPLMLSTKFSALLSLLLVFLSGAAVGGFAYRLYNVSVVGAPAGATRRPDPEEVRKRMVAEMRERLKLDDQQVSRVQEVLDQTRDRFRQVHDRMNAEGKAIRDNQMEQIKSALRADQAPAFEQWRAERDRRLRGKKGDKK